MTSGDLLLSPTGLWLQGRRLPCSIGRNGVTTDKHEGDMATPAGVHRIVGCLFRPDRLSSPAPWAMPIRPGDLWSDDPADDAYNSLVRAPYRPSHETLRRADPLYDIVLVTDWNYPDATPGRGSAIFLHRWRRPGYPTAGCIALSPRDLAWVVSRIQPGTRLVVPATMAR